MLFPCSVFKVHLSLFAQGNPPQGLRSTNKKGFAIYIISLLAAIQSWWAKVDSNHRPHDYQSCALASWAIGPFPLAPSVLVSVVEISGIEPLTSCLQGRRSPSWAKPPCRRHKLHIPRPGLTPRSRSFRCGSSPLQNFVLRGPHEKTP